MKRWHKVLGLGSVLLVIGMTVHYARQHWLERPLWAALSVAPGLEQAASYVFAGYTLNWNGVDFSLSATANPAKNLWSTAGGFLAAGVGTSEVTEHRGAFFVDEQRQVLCLDQHLESIRQQGERLIIAGSLGCADGLSSSFSLILQADGRRGILLSVALGDPRLNRLYLGWSRDVDEHFFGFGEQFSRFDLSGERLPILVSEQGVGRGLQPITLGADISARAGGHWWTSYAPVPFYLTSKLRSFFSESSAYQVFDLRDPRRVQLEVHAGSLLAHVYQGDSPAKLIEAHTSVVGRMPPLPDWTQHGAIVGLQGGTARVKGILAQLDNAQVPLAGVWLQDWVGQRTTSFGKQLWWNWTLDKQHYPDWAALNSSLSERGIRSLAYVNPFLVDVVDKGDQSRNLYQEALGKGFLVVDQKNVPLDLLNTSFSAGLVDITNPQARTWLKQVIKDEMLGAGFSGWMADFSEALPFDSKLASGDAADLAHNRFPEQWAALNREVIEEVGGQGDLMFFTRAAFSRSPGLTTSMWLGDQLVTWDAYDGLHSALLGLLSGGLSGFSLNHSDIGGYTTIKSPLKDYFRSEELLLRWMEFSAFTSLYRSHEGNRPGNNQQIYSSPAVSRQFARFAGIFAALAPYRASLMRQAAEQGLPLARPLWMHYPDDPESISTQPRSFLLGDQVLVAPVLESGVSSMEVHLPAGRWVHLWTQQVFASTAGQTVTVAAPLGQPPVFYLVDSEAGEQLQAAVSQLSD
jgi:alpha-glucosidase